MYFSRLFGVSVAPRAMKFPVNVGVYILSTHTSDAANEKVMILTK